MEVLLQTLSTFRLMACCQYILQQNAIFMCKHSITVSKQLAMPSYAQIPEGWPYHTWNPSQMPNLYLLKSKGIGFY